jgi:aldose sugar dehydrogenase
MKRINLLLLFIFTMQLILRGQPATATEKSQVETTIQLYFDGWATGDTSKAGKAMHATCHLKFFRDGQFSDISRPDYLARFKPRERDPNLVTRIVLLDITDNIAGAKTEIDTGKDIFTDYFNLIKTNEGWFIVDKISTRKSKLQKK